MVLEELCLYCLWLLTEGEVLSFEQQLDIVVVPFTAISDAATEDVEREEEDGPGGAEPAAEEGSRKLKVYF